MPATLATASAKLLDPVIQVARHSQQDPNSLLASVGIDADSIAHTGARIPAKLFSTLLTELAQRTANPRLALRIGEATQPRMLGSVGFLMSTAPNLRQAYQLFNDYLPLLIEGIHLSLEQEADQVTLLLDLANDDDRALTEWLLACLHNWTRWLTGKQVPLVRVEFAFPEPASPQLYEQFFAAEVSFNSDRNRLRLSASHFDLQCLDANEEMQRLHQNFADQLLSSAGRDGTLVAQIKSLIRNQLSSNQTISRQEVATHLNLSLRTMQRKLDQQGTPFQTLFDQTRKDLALQLIQRGDRSFGEIAYQLGFSGLSAFQKAFKRWTGQAPGAYRTAQRPVIVMPGRSYPRVLSELIGTSGVTEEQFYPLAVQLLALISEWHQRGLPLPLLSPARIGINSDGDPDYRLTLVDPDPLKGADLIEQLAYEAPEASLALPYNVDGRSELYQLGCLFYSLLHGQPPYPQTDPGELLQAHLQQSPVLSPKLSIALTRIISKLLAIPAEERYQSLRGLQIDLKQSQLGYQQRQPLAEFQPGIHDSPAQIINQEQHLGREPEQQSLQLLLQQIHHEGRLVLIEGSLGSGKSSLIECLRSNLFRSQGALLSASFDAAVDDDIEVIVRLVRQRLRHKLALPRARRDIWAQRVRRLLGIQSSLLQPLFPELNALLTETLDPPPSLSYSERRPLLIEALAKLLQPNRDPLVVFLDDLHHASSDALSLLQQLVQQLGPQPLLLVISYDPTQIKPDSPLATALPGYRYHRLCSHLQLKALSRSAIHQMISGMFPNMTPEISALADWLFQRSAGHPAKLIAELEQLRLRQWLDYRTHTKQWNWLPKQRPIELDLDLQKLLSIALTELPGGAREMLQWAAIVGNPFELELLAAIRNDPVARITIHLWPALQAGLLLQDGENGYRFSHPALPAELLADMDAPEKARIHAALGGLLYQRWQSVSVLELASKQPSKLSAKKSSTQPSKEYSTLLQRCADHLNQSNQNTAQYQRRLQLIDINLQAARQAQQQGNLGLAYADYQQAHRLLQPRELQTALGMAVILEGAELARIRGDLDTAEQWLAELQQQLTDADHATTIAASDTATTENSTTDNSTTGGNQTCAQQLALACSRLQLQLGQPEAAAKPLLDALALLAIKPPGCVATLNTMFEQLLTGQEQMQTDYDDDNHKTKTELLTQLLRVAEHQLDPLLYQGAMAALALHCGDQPLSRVISAALQLELLAQVDPARSLPELSIESIQLCAQSTEASLIRSIRITPWLEPLPKSIEQLQALLAQARGKDNQQLADSCILPLYNSCWFSHQSLAELSITLSAEQAMLDQSLSPERLDLRNSATFLVQQLTLNQPVADTVPLPDVQSFSPWALNARCALYYLLDQRTHWLALLTQVDQALSKLSGLQAHSQLLLFSSLMEIELYIQSNNQNNSQTEHRLRRLQRHQALFKHWAAINPQGFSAQSALLDAELEQLSRSPSKSHYERALTASQEANCTPLTALTLERYSIYCNRRNQHTLARLLLNEARHHYQRWGALAKLSQLNTINPE
tara:strand:+ start:2868 stop:7472 length:4605 start_codon:yes stop_codon:yes gene_type:complete